VQTGSCALLVDWQSEHFDSVSSSMQVGDCWFVCEHRRWGILSFISSISVSPVGIYSQIFWVYHLINTRISGVSTRLDPNLAKLLSSMEAAKTVLQASDQGIAQSLSSHLSLWTMSWAQTDWIQLDQTQDHWTKHQGRTCASPGTCGSANALCWT
jgi:hypothetical protein